MNGRINSMLARVRTQMEEQAEDLDYAEVEEESPIVASYNDYFAAMVDNLMFTYDCSEDDANDVIDEVLAGFIEEGALEEEPDEDTPEDEIVKWLGKAKTLGLHLIVGEAAKEYF